MVDMTPEQWRDRLVRELEARRGGLVELRRYYSEIQPFPTAPQTASAEYRRLASLAECNLCGLVVDSVNERLAIDGVRVAGDASDLDVWRDVWQGNGLDADSVTVHEEALKVGRSFVLVWPDEETGELAITMEDPAECIVGYAPGSRRKRVAAAKVLKFGSELMVTVWSPDSVWTWSKDFAGRKADWQLIPESSGVNPLGRVPLVEFRSRPSIAGVPRPEITRAVQRTQDRINKTIFDLLVLAEWQAFPQRYAIGIEVQRDATGAAINPLKVGPDRVWILDSDDPSRAKVDQLAAADLSQHLRSVDADIQRLAAITKTPIFYLLAGLVNVSADAIRALESGLVAKVRSHQRHFGESWESVFRLALGSDAVPVDAEVVWQTPDSRSLAELADAALKMGQAGYPFSAVARRMGETQAEIERLQTERDASASDRGWQETGLPALVAGGVMTPNEARAELKLPPVATGDELVEPTSTVPA